MGLSSLSRLNVSYNQLSSLEKSTFSGLSSLSSLDLSGNQIGSIENASFSQLLSLTEIVLDKNRLESLSWELFSDLKRLSRLSVRYNFIQTLESAPGLLLPSLRLLDLSSNQMTRVWNSSFDPFSHLHELDLCCNYIHTIESSGLAPLTELKRLDLSSNRLSRLPTEAFGVLNSSALVALDLSSNRLKEEFPPNGLAGLPGLEMLKLSDNTALSTFHPEALAGNPNLVVVEADHLTNLSVLPAELLNDKTRLMLFSLKYARIQRLEDEDFYAKSPEGQLFLPTGTLELTGNPVDCNCSAYALYQLVTEGADDRSSEYEYEDQTGPNAQRHYGHLVYAKSMEPDMRGLSPLSPLVSSVQCQQPLHLSSVFLRDLSPSDFSHCIQSSPMSFDSFQMLVVAIAGSIVVLICVILAFRLCCVCGCCEWLRNRLHRARKQGSSDLPTSGNFRMPESAANSVTTTTTTSIGPLLDMCGKQFYVESAGPVLTLKHKRGETHYLPPAPPPMYVPSSNNTNTLGKNYLAEDQTVYSEPIPVASYGRGRDYYNNGFSDNCNPSATLFSHHHHPGLYVGGGSYKRNNNNGSNGTATTGSRRHNKTKHRKHRATYEDEKNESSVNSDNERPPVIVTYEYPDYPNSYRLKQVPSVLV